MKNITGLILITLSLTSFGSEATKTINCYDLETTEKRLEIEIINSTIKSISYLGIYRPSVEKKMNSEGDNFILKDGHQYMKFGRVRLTENRFGTIFSAYQDVELPSKGALFDRNIKYICE